MEKKAIVGAHAFSCFDNIKTIIFLDSSNTATRDEIEDYSDNFVMSVIGWRDQNDPSILYVAPTIGNKIYIRGTAGRLFYDCKYLEEIKGIEVLDTSECTDMVAMFSGCESLTNLDLSSFNTHLVKTMAYMFDGCESLKEVNLEGVNTLRVTNMTHMFANCKNLEMVECEFDMRSVKDSDNMFANCPKFFV